MCNVLVLYYSQTGQLTEILNNMMTPLINDETITVTFQPITPEKAYDFPWKKEEFFEVFPETFLQIPKPNQALPETIKKKKYDLIILGYTVWYLTPSIPFNSFLKSEEGRQLIANTPVITVNASRNMWILAQEKVKKLLADAQAKLVGNIAFVDRNINHISVITIVHWMLRGKKNKYLGIFPKPGVSDKDIGEASKFGEVIKEYVKKGSYEGMQEDIVASDGVRVKPFLIRSDQGGNRIFKKWASIIYKAGEKSPKKRKVLLAIFRRYLVVAIWLIMPIVFILFLITYLPMYRHIKKNIKYYQSIRLR